MVFFQRTSQPAQTALLYITIGTLTLVWTGVWYVYLLNHTESDTSVFYWVAGLALTGLTLVVIGLTVGHIGRAAKHAASTPPPPVAPAPADADAAVVNSPAAPVQPAPVAQVVPSPAIPAAPVPRNNAGMASTSPR
jgi:hypothetical protein